MKHTTDATILGAGVIGASIALSLRRLGLSVTVVDAAPGAGLGSTSSSSAVIRFNYSTWDGVALAWESAQRWARWPEFLEFSDPNGNASFVKSGYIDLDVGPNPHERTTKLFRRAGIPFERWTPEKLAEQLPYLDTGRHYPPKLVSDSAFFDPADGDLGALFTPDGGYVTDPQLAAANLARSAEFLGAKFLFRHRVTSLEKQGHTWSASTERGDVIESSILVNASGPWSGQLNLMAEVGKDFTISTRPLRQEVHVLPTPDRESRLEMPVISDLDLGTYLRPEGIAGLLVGGAEPECDPLEWLADPDEYQIHPTKEVYEAQAYRAARRLPGIGVPNRPAGISGVYDVATDWTPIYDKTERDGFFVAIGTSGNQFKNAPMVGDLMALIIQSTLDGHDHDGDPLQMTLPNTGNTINLGAFSRRRRLDPNAPTNVLG